MIVVTGATGKLGRLVIQQLRQKVPANQIAAAVRSPEKAADLGVQVRRADYDQPDTLATALAGADKLLLISASEIGKRAPQHRAVIAAAKQAGVRLLVYTSVLKADDSTLSLASEHKATEEAIRASGIPYVLLRNGWYLENYTENLAPALQYGAILGSAGQGRVGAATREDLAAAAVEALTGQGHENQTYELAGSPFTLTELAAEVARHSGKKVIYQDLPEADHKGALIGAGLPEPVAAMLANSDQGIARGDLQSASGDLQRLIGRAPTPMPQAVAAALARP